MLTNRTSLVKTIFLLLGFTFGSTQTVQAKGPKFQIQEATIDSVHQAIRQGQLTCEGLVASYIDRIKKYNFDISQGPPLNAIVSLNPSIYEQARDLDTQFKKKREIKGKLFCVPVLLKDNEVLESL